MERLTPPTCPRCGGLIRPGVVWFGEALPRAAWNRAVEVVTCADLLLVVGTSGLVYPAAGLAELAAASGARVIEINPAATELSPVADAVWRESAARAVPALLAMP